MGSAIARILVGSVPSEPRLPAAPSAPVYEIGDDGGSFGSAAAPSVGLCGVTSAAFLLLGAPPAGLRERRRLGGGALERYTARHRARARWSPRSGGVPFSLAPGRALAAPRSSAGHRSPSLFPLIHRVSGALLCVVPQLRSGCIPSLQLRLRVGKAPAALMVYSAGCHPSLLGFGSLSLVGEWFVVGCSTTVGWCEGSGLKDVDLI